MNDLTPAEERRLTLVPVSQVLEENGKVLARLELPGVAKTDLEIRVEGQELTVLGRRQDPAVTGTWLLRERRRGDFEKTFTVDARIDLEKIDAELSNGVLTLSLPVKEAAKPRKIDIRSA